MAGAAGGRGLRCAPSLPLPVSSAARTATTDDNQDTEQFERVQVLLYGAVPTLYEDPMYLVHDYVRNNTPYIDVIERMYPGEFQSSTLVGRRIDMVYVTPALFERVLKASTIYDGFAKASRDPRGKEVNYPVLVSIRL